MRDGSISELCWDRAADREYGPWPNRDRVRRGRSRGGFDPAEPDHTDAARTVRWQGTERCRDLCRTGAPGSAARVDYARRPSPRAGNPALAVRIEFGYRRGSLSRSYRTDGGRRGAVPDGPDLVGPVAPPGPAGPRRGRDGQHGPAPAGRRDRSCASEPPSICQRIHSTGGVRVGVLRALVLG